jgi:hypothetical protein
MPTIADFGSYKITLYFADENPPHVHVIGTDFQAKVRIADAEVFVGAIPPRHRRKALSWISANRESLMAEWEKRK